MSSNPNFVAVMSTDEIYFGQDLLSCMTEVVDGKADSDHTHTASAVGAVATSDVATTSEVKNYLSI